MSGQARTNRTDSATQLAQEEIDSILSGGGALEGDALQPEPEAEQEASRLLYGRADSYERLPMAEVVFERLSRILAGSLRNLFQDNVEVRLTRLASRRLADSFAEIAPMALLGVFRAREWDNLGLIHVDAMTVSNLTEILLGGRRVAAATGQLPKPVTSISRNLTERLIRVVLHDLRNSFAPICDVTFDFERTETDPRFATIGRNSGVALTARLSLHSAGRNCMIDIILPFATLEPVRELLLQQFMGEKFGRDSIWESHLAEELWHTDIELEAVLDEQTMKLGAVMDLRVGDIIPINAPRGSDVTLRCGSVDLFAGRLGVRHGRLAAEIRGWISRERE
ncbi:flagellar motor switch protein FliM [Acidiphilium sp.]|uniref:flagellar motor switch protein FliM n=1 Tax=Acidiphilium sp. TaxID=527 RepID=UPI003D075478